MRARAATFSSSRLLANDPVRTRQGGSPPSSSPANRNRGEKSMATSRRPFWSGLSVLVLVALALTAPRTARAAALDFVEIQRNGANGVAGLAGVLSVVVSPDGKQVYAAGANDDSVDVFQRDP